MATFCNYTFADPSTAEGIIRHGGGTVFPYNPEFYSLASGLYGPGTLVCWYLLVASVIIRWFTGGEDDEEGGQHGVSTDLLAALAYPVIAATDAVIHAMRFLGIEYRALAIFCIRYPTAAEILEYAPSIDVQVDLRHIPPDILSLGQRAVYISGPLSVSYTFVLVVIAIGPITWVWDLKLKRWAKTITLLTYGYVVLMLSIFFLSLGNVKIGFKIWVSEIPLPWTVIFFVYLLVFCIAGMRADYLQRCALCSNQRDKLKALEPPCIFWGSFVIIFLLIYIVSMACIMKTPYVPDLAISITVSDQLAPLIGGIVTLSYTLCEAYSSKKAPEEAQGEELQTPSTDMA